MCPPNTKHKAWCLSTSVAFDAPKDGQETHSKDLIIELRQLQVGGRPEILESQLAKCDIPSRIYFAVDKRWKVHSLCWEWRQK